MPQMKPIMWLNIMSLTIIILMSLSTVLYFSTFYSKFHSSPPPHLNLPPPMLSWMWKW